MSRNIQFHWGVKIPMRDGITLNATVYTPKDQQAPVPSVVTMTPYISDHFHDRAVFIASQGTPIAVVDVRGRGNSDGAFRPMLQEANDGYDVVEWLARQPYCNGKVGMCGGSYLGYCQWATAKERPPHLATIVPTASPYAGVDFPMRNNVFYPYLLQWFAFTAERASQTQLFSDSKFWSALYREWHDSGRSFRQLDGVLGNPTPVFQEWLSHPEPDAYWDKYNPTAEEYGQLQLPILTITGSYDDDQPGALEHYRQHLQYASAAARQRHYLVIGPWNHYGTALPKMDFGGIKVGPASLVDLPRLHLEWYAWTMGGGPKPAFLKKPVAYYVMGSEQWRYAETLDDVTSRHEPYYLDSEAGADDVFSSGSLSTAPATGAPDAYTYDPRDTSGLEMDAEMRASGDSLVDQSVTIALRGKLLVYHSAPFEADTEISGFFKLVAWIAIDCPDTDLYVSVHEICLDASSIRLSNDVIRARYREGRRTPKLIQTQEPLRYDFERFTFVSRQVKRGHRLRLVIAPMGRLGEATFAEKNFNGGGVVAEETVEDARAVTVRLVHDPAHPSALHVPLGKPDTADKLT